MKYFIYVLLLFIYSCNDNVNNKIQVENPFYNKAFDYKDVNEIDSSFLYFYKAKDFSIQKNDYFLAAKCLTNLAIIQETKGDYFGSQETGISALNYFNAKDKSQYQYLSINYNTLGITASKLGDFSKAIEFHEKAIDFTTNHNDRLIYKNNLANNYRRNDDYVQAISVYNSILTENLNSKTEYARTSTNLALTKWLQNSKYNPIPEFQKALKIRLKEKDNWGLNSSYAHLADYYSKNKPDSALSYARKMYDVSKKIESPDDQIEALQKLIALEDLQNSKKYFSIYQNLNDSLQTARNKAKNQFALIRYETEKNKADFLKAKAESTERQNKIIVRNIILIALMVFLIFVYFYYRRRQKRLQQEKLLEIKNTELRYSKKVHDRVANRIYQIMSQVENTEKVDRDSLLFGLENVYETSRDISYDNTDVSEKQNFRDQLAKMLKSYSSKSVQIFILGNDPETWENTSLLQKTEIYLILQELMTNMKKHSHANKVSLKFSNENSMIYISYIDNGIGIQQLSPKNGLQNMENRIISINGKINFDTETKNVLKINLSFPI